MRRLRAGSLVASVGAVGLQLSLTFPWYLGYEDGGPYTASGWAAFDSLDIILCAVAGLVVASSIAALLVLRPEVALRISAALGTFAAFEVARRGLLGHADGDPSLRYHRFGVFVAAGAAALMLVGPVFAASGQRRAAPTRGGPLRTEGHI